MKIAPLKMTDPWLHRALAHSRTQAESLRGVPVDIVVQMEQVEILHHGPEVNYRPYLHLSGTLEDVEPEVALPYGITELAFRESSGPVVDAFYEFDNAQLADLVAKDYFGNAFQVPTSMVGISWILPATADFLVVAPEYADEVPLVFIGVPNQSDLALDEENSGYNLAEYFPDYSVEENVAARRSQPVVQTRSDEMRDMFSEDELGSRQDEGLSLSTTAPTSVFDQLMVEVQRQRTEEDEQAAERRTYDPRTAEGMYRTRVMPGVHQALAPLAGLIEGEETIENPTTDDDTWAGDSYEASR